ncbi:uncharacterized protein LOC129914863 [Episyrphus balteatus]|uniref:uncharacterized protein LOC129914863 n=1 Tax=Episyrphus balteatus TaxID=286459 RepID=UPI002486C5CE|nr:uncharacterized protein LOC129914863 [Episyrphus balteatus]
MKIFIILALIAFSSAAEWKIKTLKEWDHFEDICLERYKELIDKHQNDRADQYPKEAFEILLCVFREVGIWSDSKGFSVDRLMIVMDRIATKEDINKKFLRDSLEKCADNNGEGSTTLDWAYRSYNCFKANKVLYETLTKGRFGADQETVDE